MYIETYRGLYGGLKIYTIIKYQVIGVQTAPLRESSPKSGGLELVPLVLSLSLMSKGMSF